MNEFLFGERKMSFWDELKQGFGIALSLVVFFTLIPVALTGGFFATHYLYCDIAKLCEVKK